MNIWKLITMFFTAIGVITMIGILLSKYVVTGDIRTTVTGFEYSSPVFAFIGAAVALWIQDKSMKGMKSLGGTEFMMYVMIVGIGIIALYLMYPTFVPPSFNVLSWSRTAVLP